MSRNTIQYADKAFATIPNHGTVIERIDDDNQEIYRLSSGTSAECLRLTYALMPYTDGREGGDATLFLSEFEDIRFEFEQLGSDAEVGSATDTAVAYFQLASQSALELVTWSIFGVKHRILVSAQENAHVFPGPGWFTRKFGKITSVQHFQPYR